MLIIESVNRHEEFDLLMAFYRFFWHQHMYGSLSIAKSDAQAQYQK